MSMYLTGIYLMCGSHGRASHLRISHRQVPHERASHRYVSYRSVPYRRVPHKRVPHRRAPHRQACTSQTGVYLIDVHLMGMHLTSMHLISVHLIGIRLIKHNDSPTLIIDRIQPFYLVVRKYLRLSVVAGISHFGAKCELALLSGPEQGELGVTFSHLGIMFGLFALASFAKQNFVGEKVKCQTSGPVARHPGFIHPLYMLIYVPHDLLVHT
jgi:hypothetical protein